MNTTASPPRPLVPSDLPADKILIRAVAAHAIAAARGIGARPEKICAEYWPRDSASHAFITRAATVPATIGGSGWADTLAGRATGAFIGSLQQSAAAKLIAAGLQLDLPGYAQITLPRASSTGTPQFLAEGSPLPVAQAVIVGPTLGPPHKLGLVEVVTREVSEANPQDVEGIIGTILRNAMTRALDLGIFSATAGDATRPAGILNGITATTASTAVTGAFACLSDLRLLIDATVTAGGSGDVAFVCSPGRALAIQTYAPSLAGRVFGGAAIPSGTLICVDVNSFTSMFGSEPDLRVSKEVSIHYEDTSPLQLTTGAQGSAVVATPVRSAFQQDLIVLRMILKCAWVMRVPGAVAFINAGLSW